MAETISMPKLGFDMAEGLLVRWVKQVGDNINKGDVLAEIETDKATVEVESSASGVVLQLIVNQGDMVPVNAPIAIVGNAGEKVDVAESGKKKEERKADEKPAAQATLVAAPVQSTSAPLTSGPLKASPLAKKIARDNNVNLAAVQGSGPGGRIVRRDIENALANDSVFGGPQRDLKTFFDNDPAFDLGSSPPDTQLTNYPTIELSDKVVPTTKLRQAIGRRLVESKTTIPHFYVTHEFKMEALLDARKQLNTMMADNEKISVNDFVLKGVALALRQFPNLNATIKGAEVIQFGQVNVGVAVTVPGGLMTIVVQDTDQKSLRQISAEVKAMAGRAREGKVKPDDVSGSTFSTSNLGMYDVEDFIAIINPPEAAILAISSAREVPVVENGLVKAGWRMKATISVDHRVSDGAEAAQFMQALAVFLENPVRMLA